MGRQGVPVYQFAVSGDKLHVKLPQHHEAKKELKEFMSKAKEGVEL